MCFKSSSVVICLKNSEQEKQEVGYDLRTDIEIVIIKVYLYNFIFYHDESCVKFYSNLCKESLRAETEKSKQKRKLLISSKIKS